MDSTEIGVPAGLESSGRSVLIIDDQDPFCASLAQSFRMHGFSANVAAQLNSATELISTRAPDLIVCELKIANGFVLGELSRIRRLALRSRIVIATAYPSIATATWATRQGMDGYLAKPVNVPLILSVIGPNPSVQGSGLTSDSNAWPSLDRTIWEYVNHVFVACGSMSGAARRLKVDRRSLRRMLAKHPPVR